MLTGAVYQLPLLWVVRLVGNDEGQQRDCLAGARGHLQDRVTAGIEGPYRGVSGWRWTARAGSEGGDAHFSDHTYSWRQVRRVSMVMNYCRAADSDVVGQLTHIAL